jgi:hypothetical protein
MDPADRRKPDAIVPSVGRKKPETLVREALDLWGGSVEAMELTLAAVRGKRLPKLPELEGALRNAEVPPKDAARLADALRKDVAKDGGEPAMARLRNGVADAIRRERESGTAKRGGKSRSPKSHGGKSRKKTGSEADAGAERAGRAGRRRKTAR